MSCSKVLANNNGCGQYALIGVRLLFEGGDYNIQGLAGGGYYSRAATIRGRGRRQIRYCILIIRYKKIEKINLLLTQHVLPIMANMNKSVVLGLTVFILTEVLCVVALFSSDWLVSDHLGKIQEQDGRDFTCPMFTNHFNRQY